MDGMLHLHFVRSPYARARVISVSGGINGHELKADMAAVGEDASDESTIPFPALATEYVNYVGQPVAAVFDVDQTLVQGYTERLFFQFLLRRGCLSLPRALTFLGRLALNPQARFRDKGYLAGLTVAEVVSLARQCYQEEIAPRVSPRGVSCLMEHRNQGHAIVLLTGSLYFLLLPLKEQLEADWLIATELGRENGKFTGKIQGVHPRGENKLRLLLDLAQAQGLDLTHSYAYGDHIQDLQLFRNIGHPVAVNPCWRLKRQARRHHWPIRAF
jgi:HAD superfamily hydrolase (TIGR01490 family)